MLEFEAQQEFPWILFAIQQITVPLFSLFATGLLASALTSVVPESSLAGDIAGIMVYLCPGMFGFILGLVARSRGTMFRQAGSRIWIVPMCVFAAAFLATLSSDWHRAIPEFFGVRGGETEEGITAILLTFPTAACTFYAVGIGLRKRAEANLEP